MITHYLKLATRHFGKNLLFSLINLFGLAFGLAAAFAILLYIFDERSYERFHENAEQIVRVNTQASFDGIEMKLATAANQVAPFLGKDLPEVREALRVFRHNFGESASIKAGEDNFVEPHLHWADPNLFEVFTFEFVRGSSEGALVRVNTAVLSESTAQKFFGQEDPIGQNIAIDNRYQLEVTGVFKDMPSQTHMPFSVIGSFQSIPFGQPQRLSWGNASFYTFLLLQNETNVDQLATKVNDLLKKEVLVDNLWYTLELKPLLDIHLYSPDIEDSGVEYGAINQIWILFSLALILVFIACINYMNLATAKSQQRSREVAISKTVGAAGYQLAGQYYVETALTVLGGILLSLLIFWISLPAFNAIADKSLRFTELLKPEFGLLLLLIWVVITALSGSYPALYLSSFRPIQILRQSRTHKGGAVAVRKGLVVFQFCISSALIVSTFIFYQQLQFIQQKELGFNPEQVLALRVSGIRPFSNVNALEKELEQIPNIEEMALSQTYPGHSASGYTIARPGAPDEEAADLSTCRAYPDILDVLDIELLAGRPLRIKEEGDTITEVLLNASSMEYLGWSPEEAIGQHVEIGMGDTRVVGVTDDFHYGPLRQPIGHYAFHNRSSEWLQYLLIKLKTDELTSTMGQIQEVFKRTAPNTVFEYTFLDQKLEGLYRSEQRLASLVMIFAGLAILIACLGLFALSAFATERRTKEIGVRKVLGASNGHIIGLLTKDFLQLVGIAFLLGAPLAWWAMNRWLQGFAYHITIQWWIFPVAGLLAIIIAFVTISFQSIRVTRADPVQALKTE